MFGAAASPKNCPGCPFVAPPKIKRSSKPKPRTDAENQDPMQPPKIATKPKTKIVLPGTENQNPKPRPKIETTTSPEPQMDWNAMNKKTPSIGDDIDDLADDLSDSD